MPKVVNKDDDDKSSPSPPPRQKEPIDLCDEDGVETEDVSPSAASSLMSSRKSNTSLPPGWKKYITKKSQLKKNPDLPREFYYNSHTNKYSWQPPCGASVFNPAVAKKLSRDEAMSKLEKLCHFPALNREGNANIVDKLKQGWNTYRQKVLMVYSKFEYNKDHSAILSWHYQQFLNLDDELAEDSRRNKSCRYCGCRTNQCNCNIHLRYYWEAAQLLSLVMPSSGAAERVFSLLNNNFNQHQTRTLSDQIFLSLYLSYNKRRL